MHPNLTDLSLTDLTKLRREVLAAIKALRPKASKPKPRKVRSQSERDRADAYVRFREEQTACWACGRTENDRPAYYHGVFILERAHVCNKPRVEDVRVIVCLDSVCHKLAHGERIAGCELPPLTQAHLLYLLMERTAVDWDFLRKCNGNRPLPAAESLPEEYGR